MLRKSLLFCASAVCVVLATIFFWLRHDSSTVSKAADGFGEMSSTEAKPSPVLPEVPAATTKIQRFAAWTDNFLKTPQSSPPADLLANGIELARDRGAELAELIRKDPKAALEAAVPMAVRQRLPKAIQDELEERVSGRGFYGVLIATDFEKGSTEVRREMTLNGRTFRAFVYGVWRSRPTTEKIIFNGISLPDSDSPRPATTSTPSEPAEPPPLLAIAESHVRLIEADEKVSIAGVDPLCPVSNRPADSLGTEALAEVGGQIERFCMASHIYKLNDRLAADIGLGGTAASEPGVAKDSWSQGPKTLLYMRVAFPDDPAEPITEDEAYLRMDELNQWYIEGSYDTTQVVPTVTPLLIMPYPKAFYTVQGTGRLLSDAREAARTQAGLDTDNFTWDIVRHPNVPGFNYGGLAFVRGKGIWLQSSGTGVACHELGHNYGLWHANSWTADGDSVIGPGTHVEYGNSYDTMGAANAGANHFNAAFKNQLDWLPETFVHNVTSNGTYRIYTFDAPSIVTGQKYAIKVRKNYDRDYWAEFRQRFTHRWFLNGVLLNWDPWDNGVSDSAGGTHYLDTTPGTPDGKNDGPVVIGRTFSDIPAGVHITPIARSGSGDSWIDVVINLGAFSNNAPPVASLIVDRTSAATGVNVNFSMSAFDPDGDELAYAWDFGDATFGVNAPSVAKNWGTAGEYTVRCTVSDMK
ncbi:MAG TPA: PKD domain-containing protein, partial [Candidatus Binatia bacterium]|nr:PKD domain-containing protein [Candidatus Binatia bacterium]